MTTVSRRTFLIGLSAAVAAPIFVHQEKFLGPISQAIVPPGLGWRKITDLAFSCMPTGKEIASSAWVEDPVHYTIYVDTHEVFVLALNPRATYRWVATQDGEIVVPETSTLRILIEPCHTYATIHMVSDIEKSTAWNARRRKFSESYRWNDGRIETQSFAALNPIDAHVLEDAS